MGQALRGGADDQPVAVGRGAGLGAEQRQVPGLATAATVALGPADPTAHALRGCRHDAEWVHGVCREEFGIATTVIKPARCAADGSRRGEYRSQMSPDYLKAQHYGLRWKIESYMSALKRTTGSMLLSRKPTQLFKEAAFKVLAYALNR